MSQRVRKKRKFVIDEVMLKVAQAVAKGDRSLSEILTEYKVNERTFYRWKTHPEYQQKIDEIIADIDIAMKSERIKIAKKEIKRIIKRLESNDDKPSSRDLVALLKYVGEELGDYEPKVRHTGEVGVVILDNIPQKKEEKDE